MQSPIDISVIIVSFNTCDLLRRCVQCVARDSPQVSREVVVIDNASQDGSADMLETEFPDCLLIRSQVNLGFAAGNNRGFAVARGRYLLLLNPDAHFLGPGTLARAIELMDAHPEVGTGGGRLIDPNGVWQPSARMFPSVLNDFLIGSGLAARFPHSRFFGRPDRSWADPGVAADVDWVPGAFVLLRRTALDGVGVFDERFFMYYEEVDLCRRMKRAGQRVRYFPPLIVEHVGGASNPDGSVSSRSTLWRMRSMFLYYRKSHGCTAWLAWKCEAAWQRLQSWRHRHTPDKARGFQTTLSLLRQAWRETAGGRVAPARPW